MPTPDERSAFRRSIEEQVERRARARRGGVDAVWRTLASLQEEVRVILTGTPSAFDAARLPELLREIDRQIERWEGKAEDAVRPLYADAVREGIDLVDVPLRVARVELVGTLVSDHLVEVLANYSAQKISNVTDVVREEIAGEIRRAVLGGQSPHDAMVAIDAQLGSGEVRGFVSFRAESQVRTEMGRLHSEASHARQVQAARMLPQLQKEWLWSGKSRMAHAAVNGQRRKVEEDFDVGGEKLPHPRSAKGSAKNVILCGCESISWMPGWSTTP